MIRETSAQAFAEIFPSLPHKRRVVMMGITLCRVPSTAWEIFKALDAAGYPTAINCITPRLTELRDKEGVIREAGKRRCLVTGKMAIVWTLTIGAWAKWYRERSL